eukprot:TRINITY_DN30968_c0_g1_i1.p1 TRINITY_DN30968_c0_g1~~TRINITY_DN30968_c0_g1_i1.p1  ORF type:complete len:193 (+),score=37.52 TRINITY_DN30968_c0_g1_i1:61-639(+)
MFFVDAPFPKKKDAVPGKSAPEYKPDQDLASGAAAAAPAVSSSRAALPTDLPVDRDTVDKNRNGRVAYLESREAVALEEKELKAVREEIGREVREACRPEIDDYVDCCVGRVFSMMQCKKPALIMRRCMRQIETPEFVERRTRELLKQREEKGMSFLNNSGKGATRERRALYNRAILPQVDDPTDINIKTAR